MIIMLLEKDRASDISLEIGKNLFGEGATSDRQEDVERIKE
jgi:hypothetical protein